jgi:CRISPR system Cascade subunit CasE
MYLSRLILNPHSRRVQREVAEPYQMHRSLMRSFPDTLEEDEERVLFRLETESRGGQLILLVQSWTLPDWSWLAEPQAHGYLLPVGEPNPAVRSFALNLAAGRALAFRLRANPTTRRTFTDKKRRVGIYDEEEQIAWLRRKGEQGGFRILSVHTSGRDDVQGTIKRDENRHKIKLAAVQFDGLLQVTDPERLHETVRLGIGSGKGLGFGLLSLAHLPA